MLTEFPDQIRAEWLTAIFLLVVIALTWIRVNYARRFIQLFSAVLNLQMLRQLMRQELVFSHRASIVLSIVFLISLSSYVYVADQVYDWALFDGSGIAQWLSYLLLVSLIYFVKVLILQLVQDISDGDFGLIEYRYNVFIIAKAAGLVLLPFSVLATYAPSQYQSGLLIAGCILFIILLAYRWLRGVLNALRMGVPLFYIILYFCTLEILPLMLLYKVIVKA